MRGYADEDLDCVVVFVRAERLCSSQEVCRFYTKKLKTVNNDGCLISKRKLKTLGHGLPKFFPLWPPDQWGQPHIHDDQPVVCANVPDTVDVETPNR